ncbi:5377_t:CDS:1, partial [Rhizophagus irregularis]
MLDQIIQRSQSDVKASGLSGVDSIYRTEFNDFNFIVRGEISNFHVGPINHLQESGRNGAYKVALKTVNDS